MYHPFSCFQGSSKCNNSSSDNYENSSMPSCSSESQSDYKQEIKNSIEDKKEQMQNHFILKTAQLGSILLADEMKKGTIYKIASINIDTSCYHDFYIKLNFSCNLSMEKATIHIKFQIFKQILYQLVSVPISPAFYFQREKDSTERSSFSFFSFDEERIKSSCCNYCVYAEIIDDSISGKIVIENPVLLIAVLEQL